MTLSINIQHNSKECHYAECRYAESRNYLNVMLSVVMLNVVVLSVVRLNVIMLSGVAPYTPSSNVIKLFTTRIYKNTKWTRVYVPVKP